MRKRKTSGASPQQLKRKLTSALCMLLISSILMVSTSYAWLVLSVAPEVSGITTNIGANGALEIALLTGETRQDMTKIRTAVGESLANRAATSNTTWGNLLDLSVQDYGLNEIMLLPARISVADDGKTVNSGMLSVPTYGFDGRITELTDDTYAAIYSDGEFAYIPGAEVPDFGVRAIGTSENLSVQASALAMAKSNITTSTNSAKSAAKSTLNKNGNDLFTMMVYYASGVQTSFGDTELDLVKAMIADLNSSVSSIETALRQGLVAIAASEIGNEDTFVLVRDRIMDRNKDLSVILTDLAELGAASIPSEFQSWVEKMEEAKNDLNQAENACASLAGGSYTWDEIKVPLGFIMDVNAVYVGDTLFPNLDASTATGMIGGDITLTLAPGSGVFADVADFTGDYSAMLTTMGTTVTITTSSTEETYLLLLYAGVKDLEDAGGSDPNVKAELTSTYGYALDMAFRCNAAGTTDLLLQTAGAQRIYSDSTSSTTMGGGSYMEFSTKDSGLTVEKMIQLMDAVRVAFIDDQNNLLKVAKLNTSNREVVDGKVKAALYLYDYTFEEEEGNKVMIMGERQKGEGRNVITSLDQNEAKAVTTLVWLDGDVVDNTMVSATESASLTGVLNLQFASSAELIPAGNNALKDLTSDKTALNTAIEAATLVYEEGQGIYTTISWEAFDDAYNYAMAISENDGATEAQIYNANANLAAAAAGLTLVDHDALQTKIDELRAFMGETDDIGAIVIVDEDGVYQAVTSYTQEQFDNKVDVIKAVDYNNNLHDEGNDVFTPIYTDASWSALAAILYAAEATHMNNKATDAQIDDAITAMENAYKNLQRSIFYVPYEYKDNLYYFAISDETDTYGKWYDSEFKRIFSDLTILNLDSQAELAEVAKIAQNPYIPYYDDVATPYIYIMDAVYPELRDEEIVAIQWNVANPFIKGMTSVQKTSLTNLKTQAQNLNTAATLITQVDALFADGAKPTFAEAEELITDLQAAVLAATPEEEVPTPTTITADQKVLLAAAASSAKSVAGYDNEEPLADADAQAKIVALREAAVAAEACVANDATTYAAANTALENLNAKLTGYGKTAITEYNTLPISVPANSERFDILYAVESPSITFYLTQERVDSEISAVVLTKNGILFTATMDISVYSPAADVKIEKNLNLTEGDTQELTAALTNRTIVGNKNADGVYVDMYGVPVPFAFEEDGSVLLPNDESIKTYTWASSNTDVAKVLDADKATCQISAVGAGEVTVTLSVTTYQGKSYTDIYTFSVAAAPAAP